VLEPARAGQGQPPTIATGINLVEVYATVTGRDGRLLTGLDAADFAVAEEGIPQTISAFTAGDFPLSVAIALDRSFSMAGARLARSKEAARTFIEALRPADEVMVLAIGSEVQTITPPVPAPAAAATRWDAIDAWGSTPLYDAAIVALEAVRSRTGRRALLLLSDGADRGSQATAADLVTRARESGVLVYPVAIGAERPALFGELAAVTGGRSFFVDDPNRLESQLAELARELRSQYLIGYTPSRSAGDGPRWRSIHVTVSRRDARVRARAGYVSR
jgi:Ca-activated chloride channel homolog